MRRISPYLTSVFVGVIAAFFSIKPLTLFIGMLGGATVTEMLRWAAYEPSLFNRNPEATNQPQTTA